MNSTGDCAPGYFCRVGVAPGHYYESQLGNESNKCLRPGEPAIGGICLFGHYCPSGSGIPLPCPPGEFANQIGRSSCFVCPGRHYCPLGTENFADYPCPTGYYCPNGTKFSSEYPCPPGTYSNVTHLLSAEDCTPCPPGHYCSGEELTSPSGLCNPSFYCTLSSPVPSPANNSSYGGPCLPGF